MFHNACNTLGQSSVESVDDSPTTTDVTTESVSSTPIFLSSSSSSFSTTTTEVSAGVTSHLADTSSSQSSSLPEDIAKTRNEKPAQAEGMMYPIHTSGTVKRSFQPSWYRSYPWIEYSVVRDSVYCFPCCFFGSNHDKRLCYTRYSDWKHAMGK